MFPSDTDDKARAARLAVLRRLGPAERVRLVAEMSEDVRRIAFDAELLHRSRCRARRAQAPFDVQGD